MSGPTTRATDPTESKGPVGTVFTVPSIRLACQFFKFNQLVFVPLLGAGAVYWAMSGLAGVDSAKAILGILRRPRRK